MIQYIKGNPHRDLSYRLRTRIEHEKGMNVVYKYTTSPASREHLARFHETYVLLKKHISAFTVVEPTHVSVDEVRFPFVANATTLQSLLLRATLAGDRGVIEEWFIRLANWIRVDAVQQKMHENKSASDPHFSRTEILLHGCIDFNLDNIFISENREAKPILFDYEWQIHEKEVNAQYVLWRAVVYTYIVLQPFGIERCISLDDIFALISIMPEDERASVRVEHAFQKSLSKETFTTSLEAMEKRFLHDIRETLDLKAPFEHLKERYIQGFSPDAATTEHVRNIESALRHLENKNDKIHNQMLHLVQQHDSQIQNLIAHNKTEVERYITEHNQRIALMEASVFWKLRGYYMRVKSFRVYHFFTLFDRAIGVYKQYGLKMLIRYFFLYLKNGRSYFQQSRVTVDEYSLWQEKNERYDEATVQENIHRWKYQPIVSIVVPVYNTPPDFLQLCIDSVKNQWYTNWELCIYDDASIDQDTLALLKALEGTDDRIHIRYGVENQHISGATNAGIALSHGEFIGLLDADDELTPWALYEVVQKLQSNRSVQIFYSDEDKKTIEGQRVSPFFKPDWSPDLYLSLNYTSHFAVYRKSLIDLVGGMRKGFEGSQDYDLMLRATESVDEENICHIPAVLYHWRMTPGSTATGVGQKSYAHENGKKALSEAMKRRGLQATIVDGLGGDGRYRVQYEIINEPSVTLIIPFRDQVEVLRQCIDSVLQKTAYMNYRILLVNNESVEPETLLFLELIEKNEKVTVIDYPHPFNYSAINNNAVSHSDSEYIVFLNNDTEVIEPHWLTSMVELVVQRPDVGAVGSLLLFENHTVQHAGVVLGIGGVAGHAFKYLDPATPGYFSQLQVIRNVSAATAACLLVRKSVFDEVYGFDEKNLTVAFNDVDLCLKIRQKNYKILYTPYAKLFHHESISRGNDDELYAKNPEKHDRVIQERDYMVLKWKELLLNDPFYSKHLSLVHEDYRIRINE